MRNKNCHLSRLSHPAITTVSSNMSCKPCSREPKRFCSAYVFFVIENHAKEAATNPTLNNRSLVSHLGELWRGMKPEDRLKYQDQATSDRQRYERQSEEYKREGKFYDEAGEVVVLEDNRKGKKEEVQVKKGEVQVKRGRKKPVEVTN